jgi:hypothetical protein
MLLCLSYFEGGPLGDEVTSIDVVFTPNASPAAAKKVARRLLPTDATFSNQKMGSNPPYANRPGSCLSMLFSSPTLDDDGDATATLYSDQADRLRIELPVQRRGVDDEPQWRRP